MTKTLLRVVLLFAVPVMLRAQTTVRGTVVDQQTGTPVAGALVRVAGTQITTIATDSGTFILTSVREITELSVSRVGYASKDVPVTSTSVPMRIELVPSVRDLPGVQVVAHNPAPSTAVVTKSDLERTTGLSLVDAINTVPGVFMQTRTPFGGARITIRGYYPSTSGNSPNSNGLGYDAFLNGIPLTDATGTTVLDDVDYSTLGSVQVIKGPASSLYGSAIGGTVNLFTQRPTPNQTSVNQQLLGGGDGLLRTNTSFESANTTSDFTINYGNQQDNSFRPHSKSRKAYVRANGDFTVGSNQNVAAFFSYNRSYEELAGEIDSTDFFARRPTVDANYLANNSHIQLTSFFTGVTDNYRFSNQFSNQTSVFSTGRFANQPFAHGFTDVTQFNFGARSSFGYTGQVGAVDVAGTLGGMAQRSNMTSNGVFIIPAPPYPERPSASENYAVNGYLFTEWNFSLPAQVTLTAGADLIYNTFAIQNLLKNNQLFDTTRIQRKTFPATLAPRVQVSKGFGGTGSVYASVSSGYTPPLLTNIVASDGTVDTGLKPERAVQYEIGAQGSLLDRRLNGQAALFLVDNTDKLVSQTINTITSTTNVGKQRNRGAELSASYTILSDSTQPVSLLRPWASYTYTDARYVAFKSDNNNTAATVNFAGNTVARVPRNMVSAGLDASARNGFYLNGTYQYVSRVPVTFDNSTWVHSYNLVNGKVGYATTIQKRATINVSVGADNLTSSTYYNFLFVGPNYKGLAQAQDGGNGDGYILPAMYSARYYANLSISIPVR
jgi:iron complex outermembrane receptor protein